MPNSASDKILLFALMLKQRRRLSLGHGEAERQWTLSLGHWGVLAIPPDAVPSPVQF